MFCDRKVCRVSRTLYRSPSVFLIVTATYSARVATTKPYTGERETASNRQENAQKVSSDHKKIDSSSKRWLELLVQTSPKLCLVHESHMTAHNGVA